MSRKQIYIWLTLVAFFLGNQILERILQIKVPFLYSYLDDLLAVPITLGTYQFLHRFIRRSASKPLPYLMILICIVGFSFHFEILMPLFSQKYTADILDVAAYISGGMLYVILFSDLVKKKIIKPFSYGN